ncbi:PRUNE [Mytilus coruscus]|uniref:PRUNE n=1 Tax=Mytilus coruscus TaxID=42192 RepID=A0A6J8EVM1_MYTCO|nr:PRUNE [Mytilus coruscus]
MKLKKFLRETKTALNSGFQDKVEVHVVIGNESCDLDSAVCSVVLAYFLTLASGTKDVVVIPVLDIPQQKYHLRTETTFLLRKYEISDELLTFSDQIDLDDLYRQGKLNLSLVDHNILPQKYIGLDDCVVSVTDHRPQVRKQDNRVKINIAKVGSCATLVAEEYFNRTDLTFDPTALTFLYGAILIDTVNLSPAAHKMTDQDVAMTDKLKEMLPKINGDDLYNSIQKAKTDISELTTLELLEKDLKIVSGTSIKVAMSSVSISLKDFLSRENLIEDLSSFVQSQSVLAVIVMMIHEVMEGQPVRDIAVYSTEIGLLHKVCDQLSANRDPVLELSPVPTDKQNLTCYKQGCVRASRKVVLPLIQSIVNEYENVTSHCDEHSNSAEIPLDSIDILNLSGDQTSQNQFVASVPLDNFDLLNLASQQSSQNQSETGTNQNLMDEFDIFAGTDTANNAQINNTDVFNELPLDSQNQLDLNFDLVGTSEQTSQFESSSNVDLLGGFDPFSSSSNNTPIIVNNLLSNIPEININSEQATDEFNEADIMFGSQTLETPHSGMNSVSQGSSAHNSEPGSAFASYPITPPNSFIEDAGHAHAKEFVLPSLNSAEMLEKIREKKGRLQSTESTSADGTDNDPNSVPYTPQNSYMDGAFDQYAKDHQLPSFNSMEMVQRIKQKRSSMEMSRLDEEDDIVRLRSESGEVTPFTPHNSFRDLSLLEKNSKTFLDTNKLHQTLRNIEDDTSEAQQQVDEDSLAVKETTDSGLLMFDTSDMLNPTDIHNNVVAVGIAQEMNFQSKGGNSDDLKTEELVLDQSIDEFAQNLTENLIEDAINSFPENELPTETEKEELSATSPVSTEENYLRENKVLEILESPSSTGSVITPEEVPVETDYLSSVDPMHGNLDLVKAAEEKEIVESISFCKISGEEPQTVRQEILLRNTPDKVEEDTEPKMEESNGAVNEYAAELIQQVISGAIATVSTATNTVNRDIVSDSSSDITEESGVTWSRETSFDTVSSIPSKDGQTVIWSNQGSLDTPRSSIDKNSGATSLESDDVLLLAQSVKNGQMSSFETQESNDYLSSTSSSKRSSDPKVESSDKMEENCARDLNIDVGNEKELVQSSFNDQSDSLLEFAAGSDLDQHDGNQINNQTLLDFARSDLIQTDLLAESLKSDTAINELSNISDKPAIGMVNIDKMESVDYISSENEVENLLALKSDNAINELSDISDKPAIGMVNIDKMESVDYISSENEAENLLALKSDNAINELSDISDIPAIGMVNIDKMESVDYISSENEAENLLALKSDNAINKLSHISDKPAIGMENIDKMESVDYISSENKTENLSPLRSGDALNELSNISDEPAIGMGNIDRMESVELSSENEAENLSSLKTDDAFNELSNISDKPAVGIVNSDKMESVDYLSSENEAENLSHLKTDNAINELSNISDEPAIRMGNIDKMESVELSSENLTSLKTDNAFNG